MSRSVLFSVGIVFVAVAAACSDEPASSSGGSSSSSSSSSSSGGSSSSSSSSSGDAGGNTAPAPGKATMTAKFTNPVDGYNGSVADFASAAQDGEAVVTAQKATNFKASVTAGDTKRTLDMLIEGTPVQGMTYTLQTNPLKTYLQYQENVNNGVVRRTFLCEGTVTVDTVSGKEYRFSFTGACKKVDPTAAAGTVTVTGTGVGTLL